MPKKLPRDIQLLLSKLFDEEIPDVTNVKKFRLGYPLLFVYDAKHKSTLPYWDALPLTVMLAHYPDGFLGISLHYLPWTYRIALAERLVRSAKNKKRIDYLDIKKAWRAARIPVAYAYLCIRRYLYTHIRSNIKFFDWETYRTAVKDIRPKFQKQSEKYVISDIMRKYNDHKKSLNKKSKWTSKKKK